MADQRLKLDPNGRNVLGAIDDTTGEVIPLEVDHATGRLKVDANLSLTGDVGSFDQLDLTNSNPLAVALVDTNGDQITSLGVYGDVAAGSADSGNPVKIGGKYNNTLPTLTDGNRGDLQLSSRGMLRISLLTDVGAAAATGVDNADGVSVSTTTNKYIYMSRGTIYNGTTWDRIRGDSTNGVLVNLGANNDVIAAGDIAAGSADSGNPVKIGGKYNATPPTLTDGNRGDLQLGSRGHLRVEVYAPGSANSSTYVGDSADGVSASATTSKMLIVNRNTVYNGATWDRLSGDTTGLNAHLTPKTSGGLSIFRSLDIDETEEDIKTSAGQLYSILAFNRTAAPLYLKFYNATAANVTVGTTTPVLTIPVPANADSDIAGFIWNNEIGFAFNTAMSVACTTGIADNDTGAPGANDCVINIGYA